MADTNAQLQRILTEMETTSLGLSNAIKMRTARMASEEASTASSSVLGAASYMSNMGMETPETSTAMAATYAQTKMQGGLGQNLDTRGISELKDLMEFLLNKVREGRADVQAFAEAMGKIETSAHRGNEELKETSSVLKKEFGGEGTTGGIFGAGAAYREQVAKSRYEGAPTDTGRPTSVETGGGMSAGGVAGAGVGAALAGIGTFGIGTVVAAGAFAIGSMKTAADQRKAMFPLEYQYDLMTRRMQMRQTGATGPTIQGDPTRRGVLTAQETARDMAMNFVEQGYDKNKMLQFTAQVSDASKVSNVKQQKELMMEGLGLGKMYDNMEQVILQLSETSRFLHQGASVTGMMSTMHDTLSKSGLAQYTQEASLAAGATLQNFLQNTMGAGKFTQESMARGVTQTTAAFMRLGYSGQQGGELTGKLAGGIEGAQGDPRKMSFLSGAFGLNIGEIYDPEANIESIQKKIMDNPDAMRMYMKSPLMGRAFMQQMFGDRQLGTALSKGIYEGKIIDAEAGRLREQAGAQPTSEQIIGSKEVSPFTGLIKTEVFDRAEKGIMTLNTAMLDLAKTMAEVNAKVSRLPWEALGVVKSKAEDTGAVNMALGGLKSIDNWVGGLLRAMKRG